MTLRAGTVSVAVPLVDCALLDGLIAAQLGPAALAWLDREEANASTSGGLALLYGQEGTDVKASSAAAS